MSLRHLGKPRVDNDRRRPGDDSLLFRHGLPVDRCDVRRMCRRDQQKLHPGAARLIPLLGEDQQNLVPNGSFECGADGWGSAELDRLLDWYGPLNGLFGHLDSSTAADGHNSLKIELTPENQPVEYDDYLHTQSRRIRDPLAANVGWLAVKPGRPYTFSVAMKATEAGTPARLVVRQFRGPDREIRAAYRPIGSVIRSPSPPRPRPVCAGRSRPAADQGVRSPTEAGNGLARCGAVGAGRGRTIIRHPPADRTGSGHRQAGQHFRLA